MRLSSMPRAAPSTTDFASATSSPVHRASPACRRGPQALRLALPLHPPSPSPSFPTVIYTPTNPPPLRPRPGAYHSFALTEHGNVYSFGLNNMGQLGLGSLEPNHTGCPTLITALEGKDIVSLNGGEHHSLALSESGETYAFGRGDNNQLGFADGTDQQLTPRKVPALVGIAIRKLATQANHNVAISRSGDLYSWGFGEMGQLCNGKSADEACPALVEVDGVAGKAVLDAAAGGQHSAIVAMERND